ncbi:hypothetical protein CCACVL1_07600 [Corchorus capsularis]|uniref:Serine aminopeptidase S33 domain-containing protein n=1 Tax=Corchorus capsularis TaxID=210143 RepID=A0A1R3J4U0_COCAP|nr:hypothetical protein CCACVL1_07600 [Corchorus capsularis]
MELENGAVVYEEEFISNDRGGQLFTCKWVPKDKEPKALIFICHGYAMECSITMNSTAIRLVKAGYAVYGIDYEGHGKSSGLKGFISTFDNVVNDCSNYFTQICEKKENKKKMRYLLGESMGGAVLLLVHRKKPEYWDGAVLVAPMCQDVIDLAFKQPEVRAQVRANKYCYKGRPRLNTGNQLLITSLALEKRLNEVSLPFLVLHGEDDKVTDKGVSKLLYDVAESSDKTFKLYPGMWHGLLYGETPENIEIVFGDIINWLNKRSEAGNSRLEMELKHQHDEYPLQSKVL